MILAFRAPLNVDQTLKSLFESITTLIFRSPILSNYHFKGNPKEVTGGLLDLDCQDVEPRLKGDIREQLKDAIMPNQSENDFLISK